VLVEKGYVAIRNNRILKIVKRDGAQKRDLPVQKGSDPEGIPRRDEMVTQILPLRFGEAAKLIENLRPLLPDNATISANEASNSILMTDTQTNIRRIAEIISAIDTSVASISTIKIYPLQYANAKELATVITQLFAQSGTSSGGGGGRRGGFGGFGGFPGFGGGGGGRDGGGQPSSAPSEARQANSRVIAVADDQSNSLIVSAPEELIPSITDVVSKIDTSITDVTDTRIFRLINADATEMAATITSLFADTTGQTSQNRNNQGGRGGFGGFPDFRGQQQQNNNNQQSGRALLQSKVVAVGDARTNSLLVTAARDTMAQIAEMIGRLDATDAKKQRVYFHALEHADAESVANVLRGMLGDQAAANAASQSGASRLNQRSSEGATMDTSDFSSTNGRGGGGR
jgi:general secretion pathway protein D